MLSLNAAIEAGGAIDFKSKPGPGPGPGTAAAVLLPPEDAPGHSNGDSSPARPISSAAVFMPSIVS